MSLCFPSDHVIPSSTSQCLLLCCDVEGRSLAKVKTGDRSTWDGQPAELSESVSLFNEILVSSILLEQKANGLGHLDSMSLRLRISGKEMDVKNE